jgi:cytochrome c peroxidase
MAAYPDRADPFSLSGISDALATFQRTLLSFDAPYDRYIRGDDNAMSAEALRGMELFNSEELECFHCHGGFNFTDSVDSAHNPFNEVAFHNNGLYNVDGRGAYPAPNLGYVEFTGAPSDQGRFRAPSLRNIAVTAPYMHDGSIDTLDGVLEHYAAGGRNIQEGPNFGDGRENPNKSGFVNGFELTETRRAELLAFLNALTDENFLSNPSHSDPFAGGQAVGQ